MPIDRPIWVPVGDKAGQVPAKFVDLLTSLNISSSRDGYMLRILVNLYQTCTADWYTIAQESGLDDGQQELVQQLLKILAEIPGIAPEIIEAVAEPEPKKPLFEGDPTLFEGVYVGSLPHHWTHREFSEKSQAAGNYYLSSRAFNALVRCLRGRIKFPILLGQTLIHAQDLAQLDENEMLMMKRIGDITIREVKRLLDRIYQERSDETDKNESQSS